MNLYEAIRNRRSVRTYRNVKIPDSLFGALKSYSDRILPLDSTISVKFVFICADKQEAKVRGAFKVHAPYYLALYSEERPGWETNAGYMMEQMVLYMTAKGLGTCYMGAARAEGIEMGAMKPAVFLAFGFAKNELYREQETAKRFALKDLCVYPEGSQVSPDTAAILQAARLAPSSFNSQPWRFVVLRDRIHVFVCRDRVAFPGAERMRGINIGIVLSHIVLAAEEQWIITETVKEEAFSEKNYKNGIYQCTVRMH